MMSWCAYHNNIPDVENGTPPEDGSFAANDVSDGSSNQGAYERADGKLCRDVTMSI